MFSAARYVVIDDKASELEDLVRALHGLGAPCVGVLHSPPAMPSAALFEGVRILFTDLKMIDAAANDQQHFDHIATIIEATIRPDHGPYILVLWTSHEELRQQLSDRLEAVLQDRSKLPVAVLALDKTTYSKDGVVTKPKELQEAVQTSIQQSPAITALLSWERDVLRSANATLSVLGSMVSAEQKTLAQYPAALSALLGQLAKAGAGAHAANDPRGGVSAMLAPVLIDRILNQAPEEGGHELWRDAVTLPAAGQTVPERQRASINRMLHLAMPPEEIGKSDWGSVLPLSVAQLEDEAMLAMLGETKTQLLSEFKIHADNSERARLVLIRGGANCDHAQGKIGPIPLVLGVLTPLLPRNDKPTDAVLVCDREIVLVDDDHGIEQLRVHARFQLNVPSSALDQFENPLFRIREPLLMKILFHASSHVMRPGTLTL